MKIRILIGTAVLGILATACASSVSIESTNRPPDTESANSILPWAFVLNDPPPDGAEAPDPDEIVSVPGSNLSMRRSDISINNGPPDWHPEGHPAMPEVVVGRGSWHVATAIFRTVRVSLKMQDWPGNQ